jgi:hypothetical protein
MKITKTGQQRKTRTKDNTLEMFPLLAEKANRLRRVTHALKAVRRIMGVTDTWSTSDVEDLIDALREQAVGGDEYRKRQRGAWDSEIGRSASRPSEEMSTSAETQTDHNDTNPTHP